jgi:hypothetical protein
VTHDLYCKEFYQRSGYFELWEVEEREFIQRAKETGFDIRAAFRRWSLRDSFMWTFNHPRIDCIYDIAILAAEKIDVRPAVAYRYVPFDNLLYGPAFPVYPEIGKFLGVPGSYEFKVANQFSTVNLKTFIKQCFEAYGRASSLSIAPWGRYVSRYEYVSKLI